MRKILILPVLLMALCFPSFADGNVITLDEAISSAMENNTDMEIARLELQQSIRSANNASQYIPDLTLTGSATLVGSILGNSTLDPNSWNATAGFDVGISMGLGTSMIGTTAANNAAKILANLNYAMSLSSVEQSVTTSYWNLVSAKRGMESAKTSLEAARRTYESVQDAYSAGLATSLDLSNAELEVLNYESALKQLEDAYTLSQEAFRILTGIEGDFDVTDFPQIAYLDLPTAEELYAAYGDNTNTVRMLNATVASSEAALTVQKVSNLYPSVSLSLNYNVGGDYTHRQSNPLTHETIYNDFGMNDTASATVSFSIPVGSYIPGSKGNTAVRNAEDDVAISKINLVAGAITQPFAEMVWVTTGGDMETINRLTDILVSMNTPADRGKLFKIIKMLYGLMGLQFSEEAEPMGADPAVLEYFIFSFTADFGEIIKDYIAEIE